MRGAGKNAHTSAAGPRNSKASLAGKVYRTEWSVRPGEERNRVVLNDGTKPVFGFLDGGNKKGKVDILRQALYREASVWRSMVLIEIGCLPGRALSSDYKTLASPFQILLHLPGDFQGFRRPAHILIPKVVEKEVYAIVKQSLLTTCLPWMLNSSLMTLVQPSMQDQAAQTLRPWLPAPHTSRAQASLSLRLLLWSEFLTSQLLFSQPVNRTLGLRPQHTNNSLCQLKLWGLIS